ncbi:MAG TPA: hypothetical protein VG652_03995 [Gaiellaceae bacterium]|nr:hypothetical protein [Gaiellaceae bacterium]
MAHELDEQGLVVGFQLSVDLLALRLGDATYQLRLFPNRVDVALLNSRPDTERVLTALEVVFAHMKPDRLARPEFVFQWVAPIAHQTYGEARLAAAAEVFSEAGSTFTDFAVLADGRVDEPEIDYRLECGIVEASEIAPRLAGQASRLTGYPEDLDAPSSLWSPDTMPEVAFYCDSVWRPDGAPEPTADGVMSCWQDTLAEAERVVSYVQARFGLTGGSE